jgi:hypothetical protein
MIWRPEDKDQRVNQYLDKMNHAPYPTIVAGVLALVCAFTMVFLLSSF